MKVALYSRVSTDMQVEDGFSISAQISELTNYCKKNNMEIYNAYIDEGISGQKENRPQFQQMIKDAEKKLFNIILVHKFDRFARKVELSQRIKSQLRKSGCNVISITEPVENSPIGFFTEGIMELLAEYYVKNLAQESKKGHVQRAKEGYHNGSVPYGYKVDHNHPSKMSFNENQIEVVKLMFDLYVNKGYGCGKIAKYLNYSEIPSAIGKEWQYFTVNRILKNAKYAGYIYYDNNIYEGKHDAIITKETFDLVQKYMVDRTWKREYRGINFEKFAMLGLLKCGYCKGVMTVYKYTKYHHGYICNDSKHYDTNDRCKHQKSYRAAILESEIETKIQKIIEDIKVITPEQPISKFIVNREVKLNEKLHRLKEGYLNGVFELEEYKKRETELLKELEESKIELPEKKINIENLWNQYLIKDTPTEKRNILKQFIRSIDIYRDGSIINLQ